MHNKSDLPDGWSIPDDLAKQLIEALNKNSITPEQELQDALEEMARDIALIEPDPQDWGDWVIYLLEQMEAEAQRRGMHVSYKEMLRSLKQGIDN
jgi:hypothetical protein